jgi:glycine/D-amino acid oxidase-like deaminating enzyme
MVKRIASALLWFLVGLYGWAFIAAAGGLPLLFGPVVGAILAAVVAGDPLPRIWTRQLSTDRIDSRPESHNAEA